MHAAKKALGRRLAASRGKLTQADLAARIPISRSTIAGVERGAQVVDHEFWSRCDALLGARGDLVTAYEESNVWNSSIRRKRRRPPAGHAGARLRHGRPPERASQSMPTTFGKRPPRVAVAALSWPPIRIKRWDRMRD
jgi:transcriptional regulator with XRE-family HTH domain